MRACLSTKRHPTACSHSRRPVCIVSSSFVRLDISRLLEEIVVVTFPEPRHVTSKRLPVPCTTNCPRLICYGASLSSCSTPHKSTSTFHWKQNQDRTKVKQQQWPCQFKKSSCDLPRGFVTVAASPCGRRSRQHNNCERCTRRDPLSSGPFPKSRRIRRSLTLPQVLVNENKSARRRRWLIRTWTRCVRLSVSDCSVGNASIRNSPFFEFF